MSQNKICGKCKRELPITMFHKSPGTRDGRHTTCRFCRNAYRKLRDEAIKTGQWRFIDGSFTIPLKTIGKLGRKVKEEELTK